MKEHFIREINKLKKMVSQQAKHVEKIIILSIEAIETLDFEKAKKVIKGDSPIDIEEIRIEEECLKLLALYQPVASDLRCVIAVLKINTALEHIADFAVHMAKRLPVLSEGDQDPTIKKIDFKVMSSAALNMLRQSMLVMKLGDISLAYSIIKSDDLIDTMHADNVKLIGTLILETPSHVCYYLQAQGISRDLEHIADLTVDICEHYVYLETGKIIRHCEGNEQ